MWNILAWIMLCISIACILMALWQSYKIYRTKKQIIADIRARGPSRIIKFRLNGEIDELNST